MWHSAGTCQACPLAPDLSIKDIAAPSWALKPEKSSYAGLGIISWDCLAHFRLKTKRGGQRPMRRYCKESSQLLQDLGDGWSLDDLGDYRLVGISLSPPVCDPQRRSPIVLHPCVIAVGHMAHVT